MRKCAIGIYPGYRQFENGAVVKGVFGMVGVFPECNAPVTARCQYVFDGRLTHYYWFACDDPDHRRHAGVIEHLDADGHVTHVTRFIGG